jgi:hypothetical protein
VSNKLKVQKNKRILPSPAPVDKRLWHYTAIHYLPKIIENREIKVEPLGGDRKLSAVWLSSNPDFEQTARKEIRDKSSGAVRLNATRDEMFKAGFPPVRIEINPSGVRVYDWKTCRKISGISEETAIALEQSGVENGADPSEWYVSLQPIPLAGGFRFPIEIWNGRQWIDIERARPGGDKKEA